MPFQRSSVAAHAAWLASTEWIESAALTIAERGDVRRGAGVGGGADRLERRGGLDERRLVGHGRAEVDRRRGHGGLAEDLLELGDVLGLMPGDDGRELRDVRVGDLAVCTAWP